MAAPRGAIFARNRFGHDAPCTGALWQVPARRLETAGRGAYDARGRLHPPVRLSKLPRCERAVGYARNPLTIRLQLSQYR